MTFKLVAREAGIHHDVTIFAGTDRDHLALCGHIRMRGDEWHAFKKYVRAGAFRLQGTVIIDE